ncbi:MAG: polysaccharide deacetylase family protein [Chloroflexi bacterium]|nr:polysaccharide deacetylase family protein [Chloroflexota bacterium]
MSIRHVATAVTVLVIIAGFAMISPLFIRPETKPKVMLSFSIANAEDIAGWSQDLATLLGRHRIGASVFIMGQVAEQHPQIVSSFTGKVDIGSHTYSNPDLAGISDYSAKLREVSEGKKAVDSAGNLNTMLFQSRLGAADDDIYSLLSRSGILADFSYTNQYNVYQDGQFIRYEARTYLARDFSPRLSPLPETTRPVIFYFDDSYPIAEIDAFISGLKGHGVQFVNASELAGIALTTREGRFINGKLASY